MRLEKFALNIENAKKLSQYDVNVLFGSDSLNQNSYYLSEKQSKQLFLKGTYYDVKTKIKFYKTDIRLENVNDIDTAIETVQNDANIILFTHEWLLNDMIKEKTKKLIHRFVQLGYQF